MNNIIELNRRLVRLSDDDLPEGRLLNDSFFVGEYGETWDAVLTHHRSVVFASGGAGKSVEFRAQTDKLVASGKAAFYFTLDDLASEDINALLLDEAGAKERLENWRDRGAHPAYFFLDSVDELKLSNKKLETALKRLKRVLEPASERAHIVLSCRPFDWQPQTDLDTFDRIFPAQPVNEPNVDSDEAFISALDRGEKAAKHSESSNARDEIAAFALLHLNTNQIRAFAQAKSVIDLDGFMQEVARRDAWAFLHRPLDLEGQIAVWKRKGRLGTKKEQNNTAIRSSLEDDPDRADYGTLSPKRAEEGAKRLGLALMLTHKRTIQAADRALSGMPYGDALDPAIILTDWTPAERKALLARPLFEPASYGRVRFHNQSVESYLAAKRLWELREKGYSSRRLDDLLFQERYGHEIIVPRMREIAAWLALCDTAIGQKVLAREPEVLVEFGDPESLLLEQKRATLAAFVDHYGDGGWRGMDLPRASKTRLADPALADDIIGLWETDRLNDECQRLLMELVSLGEMNACRAIALNAAMDSERDNYVRMLAIRAFGAMQDTAALRQICDDVLANESRWPPRIIHTVIDDFYPRVMELSELVSLIQRTPEPREHLSGFDWNLYQLAKTLPPDFDQRDALIREFSKLIWTNRDGETSWHHLQSKYAHLTAALAQLLVSEHEATGRFSIEHFRAVAIACRFAGDTPPGRDEIANLRSIVQQTGENRINALLAEFSLHREIATLDSIREHFFTVSHGGSAQFPNAIDIGLLLSRLIETDNAEERELLLHAALRASWGEEEPAPALEQIKQAIGNDPELNAVYNNETRPRETSENLRQWERDEEKRKAAREAKRAARNADWLAWKDQALADIDGAFSDEHRRDTLRRMTLWLHESDTRNGTAFTNWRNVKRVMGEAFANRLEAELTRAWREQYPPVWSRLPESERNQTTADHMRAHTGLLIEASANPDWAKSLSPQDAELAAGWAMTELNGLPEWTEALAQAHAGIFRQQVFEEIKAELVTVPENGHLHTLSAVQYGPESIKAIIAPDLGAWIIARASGSNPLPEANRFSRLMTVVINANQVTAELADICDKQFIQDPASPLAVCWLRGLFAADFKRGVNALYDGREKLGAANLSDTPLKWLGTVFGDAFGSAAHIDNSAERNSLVRLASFAYESARLEDDVEHAGVYSPKTRDYAERARDRILGAIMGMPGIEAHAALMEMAKLSWFDHMPDRLQLRARQRAAADSEAAALSESDVVALETRYGFPPRNSDELFETLRERFETIDHDIRHSDFSDRPELAKIGDESVMQRRIAARLQTIAGDDFSVSREEEVADKKEPDFRIAARAFYGKAAIELKIVDGDTNWSVKQLEDTIRTQLVEQYLRHDDCRVGALVLTYAGRHQKKHPQTHETMSFEEIVSYLNEIAAHEEAASDRDIRLTVIGIDLRNPLEN